MKKTLTLFTVLLFVSPLAAQWLPNGNPVCVALNAQNEPHSIPDGAGGAIIVWEDNRGISRDIYAQRVNANGVVQWQPNGVVVCDAPGRQESISINTVPASGGGNDVYVVWEDHRSTTDGDSLVDIYAQRITSAGALVWTANGVKITPARTALRSNFFFGFESGPRIVMISSGDAVVLWTDASNANFSDTNQISPRIDIVAQRISATNGSSIWNTPLTVSGNNPQIKSSHQAVAVGNEVFCAWMDIRNNVTKIRNRKGALTDADIFYQRISSQGNLLYAGGGMNVTTNFLYQVYPSVVADNTGGAVLGWANLNPTNEVTSYYAQRIAPSGSTMWTPASGVVLIDSNFEVDKGYFAACADGTGGMAVTYAYDDSVTYADVYVQRVNGSGQRLFGVRGVSACNAPQHQGPTTILADSSYGIYVAWDDRRTITNNESNDIYAQRLNYSTGAPIWKVNGVPVTLDSNDQRTPSMVFSTNGDVIVSFTDNRYGFGSDITANRVSVDGKSTAPVKQLSDDRPERLDLSQNYPNPFSQSTVVSYQLSDGSRGIFEVRDMLGRVVYHQSIGRDTKRITIDASALPNGLYLYSLTDGVNIQSRMMMVSK